MRTVRFLATAVLIGVLAVPASAQNPPEATPIPVRGTVERLQGHTLMLKSRDGQNMTVALAANFAVLGMAKKSSDDIVTGDYVTAIGVRGPTANAKMQAVEIRIYPETMRGSREGTAPSNVPPGGVTANGTVGKITKASDGLILGLTYRGGGADYIVGPDVPVLASVPGDPTLLRPGAAVYAMASGMAQPVQPTTPPITVDPQLSATANGQSMPSQDYRQPSPAYGGGLLAP